MDIAPDSNSDETVVISNKAETLNNTFVLKQNLEITAAKRQDATTPHRSKPPIDTRCLTKSITKPTIHKKKLVFNTNGHNNKKANQENMPLIQAATRTLADPSLAKVITKSRTNPNNILTAKSGKFVYFC